MWPFSPKDSQKQKEKKFRELENGFTGSTEMIALQKATWLSSRKIVLVGVVNWRRQSEILRKQSVLKTIIYLHIFHWGLHTRKKVWTKRLAKLSTKLPKNES